MKHLSMNDLGNLKLEKKVIVKVRLSADSIRIPKHDTDPTTVLTTITGSLPELM